MTPEGKIKAAISKAISQVKRTYTFMPVPSGYGQSSLDYILCVDGWFVAIEAKAPGKKPTPRQRLIMEKIRAAGGEVWVVDNVADAANITEILETVEARR